MMNNFASKNVQFEAFLPTLTPTELVAFYALHAFPLYDYANGSNDLEIMFIGTSKNIFTFVSAVSWCGQMLKTDKKTQAIVPRKLSIHIVAENENTSCEFKEKLIS